MSRLLIERRLRDTSTQLMKAKEELSVLDEQLAVMAEMADDARIRSLVSETPGANREWTEAQGHADALTRTREVLAAKIRHLEATMDQLLERLSSATRLGT
jgi:chromosome segregation ATPase